MKKWEKPKIEDLKLKETQKVCPNPVMALAEGGIYECSACGERGDYDHVTAHIKIAHPNKDVCLDYIS